MITTTFRRGSTAIVWKDLENGEEEKVVGGYQVLKSKLGGFML